MDEQSIRKGALLKSGTPSPNPWDLTPSGQNGWHYNEGTRTEDKAPQGCDLSADSSAGMAGTAAMLRPPQNMQIQTRQRLTYCRPNLVLTMGSTLEVRLGFPNSCADAVITAGAFGTAGFVIPRPSCSGCHKLRLPQLHLNWPCPVPSVPRPRRCWAATASAMECFVRHNGYI
jgi:hypothetical protein